MVSFKALGTECSIQFVAESEDQANAFGQAMDRSSVNWEKEGNLIDWLPVKAACVFAFIG